MVLGKRWGKKIYSFSSHYKFTDIRVGDPTSTANLLFSTAVPAGGARRGHVCVGIAGVEILQRGTCCSESISDNAQ